MRKVICSNCKIGLDVPDNDPLSKPAPCSKCGGTNYTVVLQIFEDVEVHERARGKMKDDSYPSDKKQRAEFITGDEQRKSDGTWIKKDRYWNKDENIYFETVIDPSTGNTIHSCKEPLTDHVGHGFAKFEKDDKRKA
jgi:hypothetical protein